MPQTKHSPRRIDARNSCQVFASATSCRREASGRVACGRRSPPTSDDGAPLLVRHDHEVLDEARCAGRPSTPFLTSKTSNSASIVSKKCLGGLPHPVDLEQVVGREEELLGPEVLEEVVDVPPLPVDVGVLVLGRCRRR